MGARHSSWELNLNRQKVVWAAKAACSSSSDTHEKEVQIHFLISVVENCKAGKSVGLTVLISTKASNGAPTSMLAAAA